MTKQSCSSFHCPQDSNADIPVRVPDHKMLRDTSGHYWCHACMKRCQLMNWGKEHNWPEVRVQSRMHYGHYMTPPEESEWFISIAFGDEDMIDALYSELIEDHDEYI